MSKQKLVMQLKSNRFDTQKSQFIILPWRRYVSLNDLVEWGSKYDVEIPRDVEEAISAFALRWHASLMPQERARAMLFPPEPKLANIFRHGTAAGYLFGAFTEPREPEVVWKNQLVTGNPLRLRSDERDRAMSMLGQTVQDARQIFWAVLNGERPFDPAISVRYPVALSRPEREWFDALVFDTKEIFAFLYPDLIVPDVGCQSSKGAACDEEAILSAAPKRQSAHPGGLDEEKLEKQIKVYGFIRRLLHEENQPRYLTSGAIAKCFAKCLGKMRDEWATMLGDSTAWLAPARMSNPPKGSEAVWHPVMIARMLAQGVPVMINGDAGKKKKVSLISLSTLDRIFEANAELADWRSMWDRESGPLRDFASIP